MPIQCKRIEAVSSPNHRPSFLRQGLLVTWVPLLFLLSIEGAEGLPGALPALVERELPRLPKEVTRSNTSNCWLPRRNSALPGDRPLPSSQRTRSTGKASQLFRRFLSS